MKECVRVFTRNSRRVRAASPSPPKKVCFASPSQPRLRTPKAPKLVLNCVYWVFFPRCSHSLFASHLSHSIRGTGPVAPGLARREPPERERERARHACVYVRCQKVRTLCFFFFWEVGQSFCVMDGWMNGWTVCRDRIWNLK